MSLVKSYILVPPVPPRPTCQCAGCGESKDLYDFARHTVGLKKESAPARTTEFMVGPYVEVSEHKAPSLIAWGNLKPLLLCGECWRETVKRLAESLGMKVE